MPDYYKLLTVSRISSEQDIKAAYRRLALRYHPDQNPDDGEAPQRFHLINAAYQVLSDPERRKFYDRFGVERDALIRQAPLGSMGQVVGALWGEFRRRSRGGARAGRDLRYELRLSFEEAARGGDRKIVVSRELPCAPCEGTGAAQSAARETCHLCDGKGEIREPVLLVVKRVDCPFCGGSGHIVLQTCAACSGAGCVEGDEELTVRVSPGVATGKIYRLRGCGEPGAEGGRDGDLIVRIVVDEHPVYRREGHDVIIELPVTVAEAVRGAIVEVPTLDGQVRLRVPAGVRSGQRLRIARRGIWRSGGRQRGDAFVEVKIELPAAFTEAQRAQVEQLLEGWPSPADALHPARRQFDAYVRQAVGEATRAARGQDDGQPAREAKPQSAAPQREGAP